MTIEEKIAAYAAKLKAKEQEENARYSSLKAALKDVVREIDALPEGRAKTSLKPLYGRCIAFIDGEKYFTRNRKGGDEE